MSLAATLWVELVSRYERERLDKNEILFSMYGAWYLAQKQTKSPSSILSPKNKALAELSFGNPLGVAIPVLSGNTVAIGTTRACTFDDAESNTAMVSLTFAPYVWDWTMYPSQYQVGEQGINYVDYQSDWMHKLDQRTLTLMNAVDTAARNVIETNKNVYFPAVIASSYYPVVGNTLQISQAQKNDAFNQLLAVMRELDFYGKSDVLGSTSLMPITTRLENQGTSNSTNESFQFKLGAFEFTSSNRVTNGSGVANTGYLIQDGNIAVYNRNNPTAISGYKIGDGENPVSEWGTTKYPMLDMIVGTYSKNECAVGAGAIVDNATPRQVYSCDTEIGFLTPYNSSPSTKQTPIVKFEISNA